MRTEALLTPHMLAALQPKEKDYTVFDAHCPALAVRIQPGGSKSWVTSQRHEGKTRRITLGSLSDLDVEQARAALLTLSATHRVPVINPCPIFGKLAHAFLEAKEGVYRPKTLSCLRAYLNSQLIPAFGKMRIDKITTPDFAAWFYEYSRDRPGGANQAAVHFTTILNWGKTTGFIPEEIPNPASPIRRNRRAARGRMLNSTDLAKLFEVLADPPPRAGEAADLIALILLTGCRSGEVMRLKWSEIKPDRLELSHTKKGPRTILLNKLAISRLNDLRERRQTKLVFPSPYDPTSPRKSVDGPWKQMKKIADLPTSLRLHDLRHTFASHAILAGETLFSTGKLLGHLDHQSTERYAHLSMSALVKAAENVSNEVEKMLNQSKCGE